MGKVSNEMTKLSTLLVNTDDNKADIDNAPEEFTKKKVGRPKKVVIEPRMWCGMKIPGEIFAICDYTKELLSAQGRYSPAMDIMIYNAAVQQFLYNDLISNKISGRFPVSTRELTTSSESLRRALSSLGLAVLDKKQGITKQEVEVNPLEQFIDALSETGDEEVVTKKPKKKGSK